MYLHTRSSICIHTLIKTFAITVDLYVVVRNNGKILCTLYKISILQYHNQDIDIDTIHSFYSDSPVLFFFPFM